MSGLDYIVIFIYVLSVFVMGGIFVGKIKNTKDMFSAGEESPWWLSGMSSFMTMFSAGTFVVWGGIAYKSGLVAVSICLCNGIAAILIGYFIAARWKRIGVSTGAEFIRLRYGKSALQFYTWTGLAFKMLVIGVALYSVSVILCALMPMPSGSLLADPETGNLSVTLAVLLCGGIIVIYTVVGGLWAVLMTDVLQFIVLSVAVLIVIPLIFQGKSTVGGFINSAPDGFFLPSTGEFTWIFLIGWVALQFFSIGGEWGFAQRFMCVPNEKDAKKSAWLFGGLYIVSAFIWMLPPMVYRTINPDANPQEAYILACRDVLPAGLVGLMLAAMFSATASTVCAQLNVFSSVLTIDFYKTLFKPASTEKKLVFIGRLFTFILGLLLILIALSVPHLGGVENVVLSIGTLIITPLMAPTVWGLCSKRIGKNAVWLTAGISFLAGAVVRFGFTESGFFKNIIGLNGASLWIQSHYRTMEIIVGVLLPVLILTALELTGKGTDKGWSRLSGFTDSLKKVAPPEFSDLPAKILAWNIAAIGLLLLLLPLFQSENPKILVYFGISLIAVAVFLFLYIQKSFKKN